MPSSEQVINKLKQAGYKFDHETEHTRVFKKRGGAKLQRVLVPRRNDLEDRAAASILRQAGVRESDIKSFLAVCAT